MDVSMSLSGGGVGRGAGSKQTNGVQETGGAGATVAVVGDGVVAGSNGAGVVSGSMQSFTLPLRPLHRL